MSIVDFLVACIPILSWGFLPVIATLIGGKAIEQSFGIAIGSFIFACLVYAIKHPAINPLIIGIKNHLKIKKMKSQIGGRG